MSDKKRSHRRDFLRGRTAAGQVHNELHPPLDRTPGLSAAGSLDREASYLEQYSKNAMACEFEILFNLHQHPQSGSAAAAGFQLIDQLEDQLTVYRDHSEVSQINRMAFDQAVAVEARLYQLLSQSLELHQATHGAFDITSGPLTRLWQFDRRTGQVPSQSEIDTVLDCVGSQYIQLDPSNSTIRFLKQGVQINLGGIGKGHAIDRVAERLLQMGVTDFVIHGGQSSVLAAGNETTLETRSDQSAPSPTGVPAPSTVLEQGWTVGVSHPRLPSVRLAEITLRNQSLGTSGTERQGFFHGGKRYGHIIDPRTGWPTGHILSSTVITDSAARSDALATAFFVMSVDEVDTYCGQHPDVGALLVVAEKSNRVSVSTFNLDESSLKMLNSIPS